MSSESAESAPTGVARAPAAWVIVAHVVGAAVVGAFDTLRLGSLGLTLTVVPIFAATGLFIGLTVAGIERLVAGRPWWLAAFALSAPALLVFVPLARSLVQGAFAQTLPLAGVAPYVLPIVLWIGTAIATAIGGRFLRGSDLVSRAIGVLVFAGAIGAIVWVERNILRTGYPVAHLAATMAIIVLAGVAVRITRNATFPAIAASVIAAMAIGSAVTSSVGGLRSTSDRRALATFGDQSRDLVGLWRSAIDFDRDGSSLVLGGGDCSDFDAARHPGAVDKPGDGVDQDCDGVDAVAVVVEPEPVAVDVNAWRARPEIFAVLERTKGMNVLLITVDALRADLIAPDAAQRGDFPNLTKLLDRSVWFTRAFAPAAGTDISIGTLLTGRFNPFQPVALTLPEALRAAGKRTYAAIPAEVLRYAGETIIGRGVDKLVKVQTDWGKTDVGDHISAPATTAEGLKAFDEAGARPSFVWLHYFDVHESHQIKPPKRLLDAVQAGASPKAHIYRALLRAIDDELGRVVRELETRKLADRTIIVFASDHGESLLEDPRLLETHGKVTYAALTRIPIAIHIPGVTGGQRTEVVSLVDLAPTIFDLLGIVPDRLTPPAEMPLDGQTLVPMLLDAPAALRPTSRALAIHEEDQWSLVEWPHQLLVRPADNLIELYDLERDPTQRDDLATKLPDVVNRLKARYAAFPEVSVDRTPKGRSVREQLARQRPPRAP